MSGSTIPTGSDRVYDCPLCREDGYVAAIKTTFPATFALIEGRLIRAKWELQDNIDPRLAAKLDTRVAAILTKAIREFISPSDELLDRAGDGVCAECRARCDVVAARKAEGARKRRAVLAAWLPPIGADQMRRPRQARRAHEADVVAAQTIYLVLGQPLARGAPRAANARHEHHGLVIYRHGVAAREDRLTHDGELRVRHLGPYLSLQAPNRFDFVTPAQTPMLLYFRQTARTSRQRSAGVNRIRSWAARDKALRARPIVSMGNIFRPGWASVPFGKTKTPRGSRFRSR